MDASIQRNGVTPSACNPGFFDRINGEWHKPALQLFMFIVLAHWAEHLAQAAQVYILHWPRPSANGVLGLWFPWLIKSETMHYGYALVMLAGIWMLRKGFEGRSRMWWMIAFWIQFWHHIEHGLLQGQAIFGQNLFNSPVPTSIIQLWIPRVELHLFYNSVVFIPMVIGMYYHMFPPEGEEPSHKCACALRNESAGTISA
jgi:hypothetical protein